MTMRRAFLAFLSAVLALPALAQAPGTASAPARNLRVLFIGNSLTFTNDIPARFAKLAAAMGRSATVEMAAFPDYSLDDHWSDGRALAAIRKGGWDVVVLQQASSPDSRDALLASVRRFAQPIREAGARPALYMAWPSTDRMKDFPQVIAAHREAAVAIDAILLPVGEAWLRALSKDKRLRLYGDLVHPASLGADLAALTIYLTLFPAGPTEFDEAFVARAARALDLPAGRRDQLFDAATLAIDEPMSLK